MPPKTCVFCGKSMQSLGAEAAAEAVVSLLISPNSSLFSLFRASSKASLDGEALQCTSCGWLALFPKLSRR